MKTILVPVDFSAVCDNALNYAIAFAGKARLQIILFNVYDIPIPSGPSVVWIPPADELIGEHRKRLESIRTKILRQHGDDLIIRCYCEPGAVGETIQNFARKQGADLIIMGMQGGGFVSEKIIGSTTTSLMRKAPCPVLGIAKGVTFKPIRRIAFATDYADTEYLNLLKPLREIIRLFDAHLYLVHVQEPTIGGKQEIPESRKLTRALGGIPFTAHVLVHAHVVDGLGQFIDDRLIDLVVMIPREHSFFYTLFRGEKTKQMAFHAAIPVLALHH